MGTFYLSLIKMYAIVSCDTLNKTDLHPSLLELFKLKVVFKTDFNTKTSHFFCFFNIVPKPQLSKITGAKSKHVTAFDL